MSDGCREKKTPISPDGYGRATATVAIAQLCQTLGFRSAQRCVLDALTDVAIKYVSDLGKSAKLYANSSGRSESNLFDVLRGLDDLGPSQSFPPDACPVGSGVIQDIRRYLDTAEETPFTQLVPRFPIAKEGREVLSFMRARESPPIEHVPAWLPRFPEPHTYIYTTDSGSEMPERKVDKLERSKQRRRAERSLLNLHKHLACITTYIENGNVEDNASVIPFLATQLPFGEREVSPVDAKLAIVDSLAPVIEVIKKSAPKFDDSERDALPRNRVAVCFKLGFDKRTLNPVVPLTLASAGAVDLWVPRDEERNDKKRRAELILRESVENPHELFKL